MGELGERTYICFPERVSAMVFDGIIITGTSNAGKSTIAKELCGSDSNGNPSSFEVVSTVTTRKRRNDDFSYEYTTDEEFANLLAANALLTNTTYLDKHYGIKMTEFKSVVQKNKLPILILNPSSVSSLIDKSDGRFMCFFIDATDEKLIERWQTREKRKMYDEEKISFTKQLALDRNNSFKCDYVLKNNNIAVSVSLIAQLWEQRNRGGGLSYNIIKSMIECEMLLEHADASGVKGASYDLLLGDEYYYAGKIKHLSEADPFLTIEPYDYAIVSCKERACMPRDVTARFGLTVGLFCQGIILSNGPQIDPGFHGTLFCLLFNTSNRAVHLKRGKHYATIEFNKLIEPAKPYEGKYQGAEKIIEYIPANALQGAINELKKDIERLKDESKLMQNIYLVVAGLMFAIISILLVLR